MWQTVAKGRKKGKKGFGDSTRRRGERKKSDIFISTRVSSVARVRHRASASINIHRPGFLSGARVAKPLCTSSSRYVIAREKRGFLQERLHNFERNQYVNKYVRVTTIARLCNDSSERDELTEIEIYDRSLFLS